MSTTTSRRTKGKDVRLELRQRGGSWIRHGRLRAGTISCLLSILLFVALGDVVVDDGRDGLDHSLSGSISTAASPGLTRAMQVITFLGSTYVTAALCLIAAGWLFARRRRAAAILVPAAWVGGQLLGALLKIGFQRDRPTILAPWDRPEGYSFPSGHTVTAVITYGLLAALLVGCLRGRGRLLPPVIAVAIIIAVGFSRIVLGAHFPADVLGGLLAGGAWLSVALVALYLAERRPALRRRLRRAPERLTAS